jgi:hypothetical protein
VASLYSLPKKASSYQISNIKFLDIQEWLPYTHFQRKQVLIKPILTSKESKFLSKFLSNFQRKQVLIKFPILTSKESKFLSNPILTSKESKFLSNPYTHFQRKQVLSAPGKAWRIQLVEKPA